jgi:hypothetical protein
MARNVELMRFLLLELGRRQRSPAEPFFIPLDAFAAQSGVTRDDIIGSLQSLQDADFIEGPGAYVDQWLFRKLTQRGEYLLRHVEDEQDWRKLKQIYGDLDIR